jgi:hypothetical protein
MSKHKRNREIRRKAYEMSPGHAREIARAMRKGRLPVFISMRLREEAKEKE